MTERKVRCEQPEQRTLKARRGSSQRSLRYVSKVYELATESILYRRFIRYWLLEACFKRMFRYLNLNFNRFSIIQERTRKLIIVLKERGQNCLRVNRPCEKIQFGGNRVGNLVLCKQATEATRATLPEL